LVTMGGTCAPGEGEEEEHEECNMDAEEEEKTVEQFTKIINDYQAENEALLKQLEECKQANDEEAAEDKEEKAKQNEEVMRELEKMKALVETKDALLVKGRLEAALLSKATTMLAVEAKTKSCMKGTLRNMSLGRKKSKKPKWVEVHVTEGELLPNDYAPGFVTLTYSDSADSAISNRCKVIDVSYQEGKGKELMFTLKASVQNSTKDLVFACESSEEREDWVTKLRSALAEVKDAYDAMHELITFSITFEKEKLGFRVQENMMVLKVQPKVSEEKVETKDEGILEKTANEIVEKTEEVAEVVKDAAEEAEIAAENVVKEVEAEAVKECKEEEQKREPPCLLTVSDILDPSLFDLGLKPGVELRSLNNITLPGKGYGEQLQLLQNTPKPFDITFATKGFKKSAADQEHGYTSILKELVDEEENSVKNTFNDLIRGTPFEDELKATDDKTACITALLSNQRRLLALIRNCKVNENVL